MHGSIDWFDISPWEDNQRYFDQFPFPIRDRHPIFGNPGIFCPSPLIEEPYFPDSQLRRIRRIQNLAEYLQRANLVMEAPLILAPSRHKLLYSDPLKELWWGMDSAGSAMEGMAVIGFSLPAHDQYAVQAIYAAVRNFQHYDTGGIVKKAHLQFVDWCPSDDERRRLMERYCFVDWRRTGLDGQGFRPEVLRSLFAGPASSADA